MNIGRVTGGVAVRQEYVQMLFEQLDYLYVPSRDVSADVAYATDW